MTLSEREALHSERIRPCNGGSEHGSHARSVCSGWLLFSKDGNLSLDFCAIQQALNDLLLTNTLVSG